MQKRVILVDDKQLSTILTALDIYKHGGLDDLDADKFTHIDELVDHLQSPAHEHRSTVLATMKEDGMLFGECLHTFSVGNDDPYVVAARKSCNDDLNIDSAITSESANGAWVMAWVWVSNEEAGIQDGDEDPADSEAALSASKYLETVARMSTDELDGWYQEHVGYRLSEDDPSVLGKPEHGYAVAEMMCLHAHGEGDVYHALLDLIKKAKGES